MMSSRFSLVAACCILALVLFVGAGTAIAQGSEAKSSEKRADTAVAKQGEEPTQQELVAGEWEIHREYLRNLVRVDDLLVEAGKAAQAGESDKAMSEIHEARKLIDEMHQAVHQHMGMKIEHVKKTSGAKGSEAKKHALKGCPLCEKHSPAKSK
jgi:hypothetical protein